MDFRTLDCVGNVGFIRDVIVDVMSDSFEGDELSRLLELSPDLCGKFLLRSRKVVQCIGSTRICCINPDVPHRLRKLAFIECTHLAFHGEFQVL